MRRARVLVEGRPGTGKTTVARRVVELLTRSGVPVTGFTTEEIRERGHRQGFAVESISGERATLASIHLPGPPRVGKYGVDLEAFERVALPSLTRPDEGTDVVVDELGKMELASPAFRRAVEALIDDSGPLVATIHVFRHPFTDALKERPDVELLRVTERTRDELPAVIADRFT